VDRVLSLSSKVTCNTSDVVGTERATPFDSFVLCLISVDNAPTIRHRHREMLVHFFSSVHPISLYLVKAASNSANTTDLNEQLDSVQFTILEDIITRTVV
jgi:hypothetical protein